MAPEQVVDEPLDGRTDLYGLGCVAYYLLTGRLPFEAETVEATLASHLYDEPCPPSKIPGAARVPPGLEQLVMACLAKEPEDRPASARILERLLAQLAIDPWTESEAGAWWRAHRTAVERDGLGHETRPETLLLPSRLDEAQVETWSRRLERIRADP